MPDADKIKLPLECPKCGGKDVRPWVYERLGFGRTLCCRDCRELFDRGEADLNALAKLNLARNQAGES